ncbi:MAG: hypothetical protein ABI136_02665 [Ginsengibacter sp.]
MKKIIFLSTIIVVAISCNQNKQEYSKNADVLADNLKGNVQQTVATDYKADSSGKMGEQDSCCVLTTKYDEKGYVTEYDSDDKSGKNKEVGTLSHDENGNMKDMKNTKNGNAVSSITVLTDSAGKYSLAKEYDSANHLKFYYTDISQNEYGQLTGMKKHNADSSVSGMMVSKYNNSILTDQEVKDSTGKVIYSSNMKFDDKNNVVENDSKNITKDSTVNKVIKYKYDSSDDQANWTQRTELDENGKPVKIVKREITYYKK